MLLLLSGFFFVVCERACGRKTAAAAADNAFCSRADGGNPGRCRRVRVWSWDRLEKGRARSMRRGRGERRRRQQMTQNASPAGYYRMSSVRQRQLRTHVPAMVVVGGCGGPEGDEKLVCVYGRKCRPRTLRRSGGNLTALGRRATPNVWNEKRTVAARLETRYPREPNRLSCVENVFLGANAPS